MRRLLPTLTALCLALSVSSTDPAFAATQHRTTKHRTTKHRSSHHRTTQHAAPTTVWDALTDALSQSPLPVTAALPAGNPTHHHSTRAQHVDPMSRIGVARFGARILSLAAQKAGSPYVYGAAGPTVFDCSGYTRFVYGEVGVSLPHSSYAQYGMTEHLSHAAARPGDLVFMRGLGHVGIYAGDGMMWDAPTTGGHVSKRAIYGAYTIGRVIRHG